jgi:hypothetical protein
MPQIAPGFTGIKVGRVSSLDKRTIGTFTDQNKLNSLFRGNQPQQYDKKIISLYTQSSLQSNDFLRMLEASNPFYLDGSSDSFTYKIVKPYQAPKIISVPDTTLSQQYIGVDGKEFEVVLDIQLGANKIFAVGHRWFGQQFYVKNGGVPYNKGWLHKVTLVTDTPSVAFVDRSMLQPGIEIDLGDSSIGEFDEKLPGLPKLADTIQMYETLGSGFGVSHSITSWADDYRIPQTGGYDRDGNVRDIIYYREYRNGQPQPMKESKWEPYIERLMREDMLKQRTWRQFFAKPSKSIRSAGDKQELKIRSAGILDRIRRSGNYVPIYKGQFSVGLVRTVFGDLFYRRVSMGKRKVVLYTNEQGFAEFQQVIKQDATNSGLVFNVGDNDKFVSGSGQNLSLNFAFNSFVSMETGEVRVVHLTELDLPQTNVEFTQDKRSTPIYIVFDVTPSGSNNGFGGNIRPVKYKDRPNIEWSYINGRRHHLGAYASQGHDAANQFPGYIIQMEAREDIFIEDLSRCVLIEELPQY